MVVPIEPVFGSRQARGGLVDPVQRLGKTMVLLAGQLSIEGQREAQERLQANAFQLFRVAAEIAKLTSDEQRLADAATAARLLTGDPDSPEYKWMQAQLALTKDPDVRQAAEGYLDRLARHERGETFPHTTVETTEKQIYENLAAGAGIDLADLGDPTAEIVRNGIKDRIWLAGPAGAQSVRSCTSAGILA